MKERLSVKDVDIKNKKVLMRCDFNVPLDENRNITDDTRIKASLPTIEYCLNQNCSVILMSHLGRPKGKVKPELSLKPVYEYLRKYFENKNIVVKWSKDCIGEKVKEEVSSLNNKEVLLIENLRFHPEEEANDSNFAKSLSSLGEVFVQDAFGSVHRKHASTVGITNYLLSVSGFLLQKEIEFLNKALENPTNPYLVILGGAKVSDKIDVIENLMDKADSFIIGGAMAYTFLKTEGVEVGSSLVEEDKISLAKDILEKANKMKKLVLLPIDHVIANEVSSNADVKETEGIDIPSGWKGVDIGPQSLSRFSSSIYKANTILWNGPVGVFEIEKFSYGTSRIAHLLAEMTSKGATTIVGGGDSVAAIKKFNLENKFSHISTGGGASLEFLEGKQLPGIMALKEKK